MSVFFYWDVCRSSLAGLDKKDKARPRHSNESSLRRSAHKEGFRRNEKRRPSACQGLWLRRWREGR